MLDEFRKLGGVAENIEQRPGIHGNGIFPIDSGRPIRISIPPHLLIDTEKLVLDGEDLIVRPDANVPNEVKKFVARYQKYFSWGAEGRKNVDAFETALTSFPPKLLERLRQLHLLHLGVRHRGTWIEVLRERFLFSRRIFFKGRRVSMPIIELINHSAKSSGYRVGEEISYKGRFAGEVLVNYSQTSDALRRFFGYGFSHPEPNAFSMQIAAKFNDSMTLKVGVDTNDLEVKEGLLMPKILDRTDTAIQLSHLRLGMMHAPRMPRTLLNKILSDQPPNVADEVFERIRSVNQRELCNLLELSESLDTPVGREFRRAVIFQLKSLSYCYGCRPMN